VSLETPIEGYTVEGKKHCTTMNPTIWAKTDQSYEEHITNAYHA